MRGNPVYKIGMACESLLRPMKALIEGHTRLATGIAVNEKTSRENFTVGSDENSTTAKRKGKVLAMSETTVEAAPSKVGGNFEEKWLLTATESARLCGVGLSTWWRLVATGKTPAATKLGRSTKWRRDELAEWIFANCPPRAQWEQRKTGKVLRK